MWLHDYLIQDAVEWASKNKGIIWFENPEVGYQVAKLAKIPYYGGGEEASTMILGEKGDRTIVASIAAHGTGKNLQHAFSKNLIIQTPKQITVINEENHRHRRIYLDREHPKALKPSYAGHSIGHWEGDTLVVHTIGLRERDGIRNPPNYSVTERFHKINDGKQMEYSVTFDSDAYATPGTSRSTWTFRPDLHIQEEVCEQFSDNFNDSYFSKGSK